MENKEILLVNRPEGLPTTDIWKIQEVAASEVSLKSNQLKVKSLYVSVDPYLRGILRYATVGEAIASGTVAEVIESTSENYKVGDIVVGYLPWRIINICGVDGLRKVDSSAPLSTYLGINGMPGITAYFGLTEILKLKAGETVLISGGAGAVGSAVAQMIRAFFGSTVRIIGTAGGREKSLKLTSDYGFDVGLDYKLLESVAKAKEVLEIAAPKGIDAYFDNTGGYITEAAFDVLNKYARVAICGQISMYNNKEAAAVGAFLHKTIYKSVTIRGFVQSDFQSQFGEFFALVPALVQCGKIRYDETIVNGFEKLPEAFLGLFTGANVGKMIVKI